ncbi:hypothetical protein Q457_09650, partial [Escherichia coli ATCC BAA-2196]
QTQGYPHSRFSGAMVEETGMFIHHHFGLMYMLSFLTLVSDGRLQ